MITLKSLQQIDFAFAVLAFIYAILVTLVPALLPLAAVFATPTAAAVAAIGAGVRWAAGLKRKGADDDGAQ